MRNEVIVKFSGGQELRLSPQDAASLSSVDARQWLDQQFVALDCEPLRPSGKVLLADKILVVAATAGLAKFSDTAWGDAFARSVVAALGKPVVTIDVKAMEVGF